MDARLNPYTPNAGARPPVLVGRDDQLEKFELLLARLREGRTEQSMIITGLRGVGKTVLLGEFRQRAAAADWAVAEIEVSKHDDAAFRRVMAREARRLLYAIAPSARWRDKAQRAARTLKSFSLTVSPDGAFTAGLDVAALEGVADSGMLDADLTDLFLSIGEAAREHETGVVFLLDEIQFLSPVQMEAVIAALHKTVQRALPVTMVAAGLPQLPELAGEAKSYAERLFKFPAIGQLSHDEALAALVEPARQQGAGYDEAAAEFVLRYTEGYPYFLQEFGYAVWETAHGPRVSLAEAEVARGIVEEKLDGSFFKVRLDRTTTLERAYLRAMAELGSQPHLAGDVAALLDRTSAQCGPTRARLIDKGLLYTPNYGHAAFTVPQFDRFLKRRLPDLQVPPKQHREPRR